MSWMSGLLCVALAAGSGVAPVRPSLPLAGLVVIIDPGHGGTDPGTRRKEHGRWVTEAQLNLGVALHLRQQVEAAGGQARLTVLWPQPLEFDRLGAEQIPVRGAQYYRWWEQPLITKGNLARRLDYVRLVQTEFPAATIVFISLHFDHVRWPNRRPPISGARLIYPAELNSSGFVVALGRALAADSLLRHPDNQPLVVNGQRSAGVKRLLVLRGQSDPRRKVVNRHRVKLYNPVEYRVLIELANLPNARDWDRLHQAGSL